MYLNMIYAANFGHLDLVTQSLSSLIIGFRKSHSSLTGKDVNLRRIVLPILDNTSYHQGKHSPSADGPI